MQEILPLYLLAMFGINLFTSGCYHVFRPHSWRKHLMLEFLTYTYHIEEEREMKKKQLNRKETKKTIVGLECV